MSDAEDAPWPKDEIAKAAERPMLDGFLGHQRRFLAAKADGLTDAQARSATCPPSDLSILGLIRHMSDVERHWSQEDFLGADVAPIYYGPSHPDGDEDGGFHPPPDASISDALDTFWTEVDASSAIFDRFELDDVEQCDRGRYNLRWILVHLIEEYARHVGHADLIRESIDGSTGE